jgi:transcription termination/antitermination protein NusG
VNAPEGPEEKDLSQAGESVADGDQRETASKPQKSSGSFIVDEMTADGGPVGGAPAPEQSASPAKIKKPTVDVVPADPNADWYILKVAFNREDTIREALEKRVKMEGMQEYFNAIVVPTEDVVEFTRAGKRRITKRKLLPGYIMVNMVINDDTWFLVRETAGISDFTGAAGTPMPMNPSDVERFITKPALQDDEEQPMKTAIPYRRGDRVRVKEGNFENQEGEVDQVDEANGRVTVIINIFGRSVPMELDHWQVEAM